MGEIELSIIIPVYNVENYLSKCIESVLKISNISYEIILVNDGSTDKSGEICKKYYKTYSNIIKYIVQENKGLSESRNNGIKNAKGKYLFFLDSDDYIDSNEFNIIFKKLKQYNPDILYFGYYYETEFCKKEKYSFVSEFEKLYDAKTFLKHELKSRNLPAAVCFGIYKKELIVANDLYFQAGILHEDERWSPVILLNSKKIYTTGNVLYHYVQRDNSIMHIKDKTKNGIDLINTCKDLDKKVDNIEDYQLKKLLKNKLAMLYMRGTVIGKLHRIKYRSCINRFFPVQHASLLIDKIKSVLYMISPTIYYVVAKIIKRK